ncbi:MAG TPA: hypothetical protein VF855_09225, partial [Acidimicrobiales bacterium]
DVPNSRPTRERVPRPGVWEDAPPLVVVTPRQRRRRVGLVAVLGCTTVFGVLLGLAAFQTKIAGDQLRLDRVNADLREAQVRYETLRGEVARLESPANIVAQATKQGMVSPGAVTYLTPSADDVSAVVAATGDTSTQAPAAAPDGPRRNGWSTVKPLVGTNP